MLVSMPTDAARLDGFVNQTVARLSEATALRLTISGTVIGERHVLTALF